jgi:hypothetical protein
MVQVTVKGVTYRAWTVRLPGQLADHHSAATPVAGLPLLIPVEMSYTRILTGRHPLNGRLLFEYNYLNSPDFGANNLPSVPKGVQAALVCIVSEYSRPGTAGWCTE